MSIKATVPEALVAELHEASIRALLERIKSGTATAADLNVARAFCRDSGVTAVPAPQSPMGDLAGSLPKFDEDDGIPTAH